MNKKLRTSLDVVLYVVVYLLLQFVVHLVGASIYAAVEGVDAQTVLAGMAVGEYGWLLAVEMVVSSGLAIWLFLRLRWAPVSRDYLASKPWTALVWVALLTLGLLLPSQWLYEQLQVSMSEDYQRLFEGILKEPWGYAAIGLLAPLAEEMVFRGAVLRTLLGLFDRRRPWLPIGTSFRSCALEYGTGASCFSHGAAHRLDVLPHGEHRARTCASWGEQLCGLHRLQPDAPNE